MWLLFQGPSIEVLPTFYIYWVLKIIEGFINLFLLSLEIEIFILFIIDEIKIY